MLRQKMPVVSGLHLQPSRLPVSRGGRHLWSSPTSVCKPRPEVMKSRFLSVGVINGSRGSSHELDLCSTSCSPPPSACCRVLAAKRWRQGKLTAGSWLYFWRSYWLRVFPPGPWVAFPQSLAPAVDVSDTAWVSKPLRISVVSEAFEG